MAVERAIVIGKMRAAFRAGESASTFISDMQDLGLGYRRADMFSDWRTVNEIEKKEGVLRFIRKDYYPAETSIAAVEWALSKEYMYKVQVQVRTTPKEPIETRFVNLMSDIPMTPEMIEDEISEKWGEWEVSGAAERVGLQVWSAFRRTTL
ncbi:MAG: hypothetical protein MUP81_03675 [Dehalococcoidia bacterium]|nr:hypothetical protein [Dehalococcoidia bacterium]